MISIDKAVQLKEVLSGEISVECTENDRLEVSLPFIFDDGDQLSFFADRKNKKEWRLSDDGEVIHRAEAAGLDLSQAAQSERLASLVEFYGARTEGRTIKLDATSDSLGDDLFAFAQTCLEASWLSKMNRMVRRESTKAQFNERLGSLLSSSIDEDRIEPKWFDATNDPDRLYPVDYRIQGKERQLFLFAVSSVVHCAEATISCLHHKNSGTDFLGVVVYEEETKIRKKHADRLNDVADKRFPRIGEQETITKFLSAA